MYPREHCAEFGKGQTIIGRRQETGLCSVPFHCITIYYIDIDEHWNFLYSEEIDIFTTHSKVSLFAVIFTAFSGDIVFLFSVDQHEEARDHFYRF